MTPSGAAPATFVRHGDAWRVAAASVVKAGHADAENEDAVSAAPAPSGALRVAVADGATESAFARTWARRLADAACASGRVAAAFAGALPAYEAELDAARETLPWYAAAKADAGAYAALLVVTVGPEGRYRAEAVGDAVLFEVDARGRRVAAWPLDTPEAFDARPVLLGSSAPLPPVRLREGTVPGGGRLLLATDALAAHLLRHPERGWPPADAAPALPAPGVTGARTDASEPQAWVDAARAHGLRNDDTTWAVLERTT